MPLFRSKAEQKVLERGYDPERVRTLGEAVACLARSATASKARDLAHHLAGLFGLPWPEAP